MTFIRSRQESSRRTVVPRNWEADIECVKIEPCESGDDPLGYRAVFVLDEEKARLEKQKSFIIGASFLAKRKFNLSKAGYEAPMTHRAITMIENEIGKSLPILLA